MYRARIRYRQNRKDICEKFKKITISLPYLLSLTQFSLPSLYNIVEKIQNLLQVLKISSKTFEDFVEENIDLEINLKKNYVTLLCSAGQNFSRILVQSVDILGEFWPRWPKLHVMDFFSY